jgi:hypothetical protein
MTQQRVVVSPPPQGRPRPPYLLGLLGVIPLVGAFIGFALILYGIIKYRDKWLVVIGSACILFTVLVYSSLFYFGFKSAAGKENWANMSQMQLTGLIKGVEYYKLAHGRYPDSLPQLRIDDKFVFINDPLRSIEFSRDAYFNYKNLGNKYLLFSSGIDGIKNTKDDLYPKVDTTNKNIGWIRSLPSE